MIKCAYRTALVAVSVVVLSWFLPWLYSLVFPDGSSDPFVAYSPVADAFIISERGDDDEVRIYDMDSCGVSTGRIYTKEERDSLLPQVYFSQLINRQQLPDSMLGKELTMQAFRRNQWVFNSSPRDVNRRGASVYMIMESMPVRFDLEDAKEVFRLDDRVEFVEMATNSVNEQRGRRFSSMFAEKGFMYPARDLSANVTTRKSYDEGYLIADAEGSVFHMKMQAGRPYLTKVSSADSVKATKVFITENVDRRYLGFVSDEEYNLYVVERDGYKLVRLPVGKFDPASERLMVMKNLFNWVVKVSGRESSRWVALDSDNLRRLGEYSVVYGKSRVQEVSEYIFPFELSFTSSYDSYAYPRIEFVSWRALYFNLLLAMGIFIILRRRSRRYMITASVVTLVFGIFSFIPFALIKD